MKIDPIKIYRFRPKDTITAAQLAKVFELARLSMSPELYAEQELEIQQHFTEEVFDPSSLFDEEVPDKTIQ